MAFLGRSIVDLTKDDIERVVREEMPEDGEMEFKREVEVDANGRVRDSSRNDIARELVAFANGDGGTLIIGIEESGDDPKRAATIRPIGACHELAERLRRAVSEIIEPKLPMLHSRAVETQAGAGVIVFNVPHSSRAPHRVEPLRDCFRRSGNESRKMTMREIQELTLVIANEASRLDERFNALVASADKFRAAFFQQFKSPGDLSLAAMPPRPNQWHWFRMSAVPLNPLSIARVAGMNEFKPVQPTVRYRIFDKAQTSDFPWGREYRGARPIVRGERRTAMSNNRGLLDEIYNDGALTLGMVASGPRIYSGWVLNQLAAVVMTANSLRFAGGAPDAEFAIELSLETAGDARFKVAGQEYFDDEFVFENGMTRFPRYSLGPKAEWVHLINEIMQDILHASGCAQRFDWQLEIL